MNLTLNTITRNLTNLIYPLHCAGCAKPLDAMDESGACDFCKGRIRRNPRPHCKCCGRSVEDAENLCAECNRYTFRFSQARSACLYEDPLKEFIHQFKYKRNMALAGLLSDLMTDFAKTEPDILRGIDIVTCVPLQDKRLRDRGFNQSGILAARLSKEFGLPFCDSISKTRSTRPQNELTRDERLSNLSGAFIIKDSAKDRIDGMDVLLIDDVMTTGATLSECSGALKDAGARSVKCLTLARGI